MTERDAANLARSAPKLSLSCAWQRQSTACVSITPKAPKAAEVRASRLKRIESFRVQRHAKANLAEREGEGSGVPKLMKSIRSYESP